MSLVELLASGCGLLALVAMWATGAASKERTKRLAAEKVAQIKAAVADIDAEVEKETLSVNAAHDSSVKEIRAKAKEDKKHLEKVKEEIATAPLDKLASGWNTLFRGDKENSPDDKKGTK